MCHEYTEGILIITSIDCGHCLRTQALNTNPRMGLGLRASGLGALPVLQRRQLRRLCQNCQEGGRREGFHQPSSEPWCESSSRLHNSMFHHGCGAHVRTTVGRIGRAHREDGGCSNAKARKRLIARQKDTRSLEAQMMQAVGRGSGRGRLGAGRRGGGGGG